MTYTALVTGGTRGIGAAICQQFKEEGYRVAANYGKDSTTAKAFEKATGIATYQWDVGDPEACMAGVSKVEKALGPVDVLVNNAGIIRDAMMHKMELEDWHHVITTNLNSCFYQTRAVLQGMRERGYGRIINISSINGQVGQLGQTNYSAAKAGVIGFTKALAKETAAKGITVNAVAPGYIETDMTKDLSEDIRHKLVANIPVHRLGSADEIARCVTFLASEEAGFITGEVISANGGQAM